MSGGPSDRFRNRIEFYADVVAGWIRDHAASILVVGGGANDQEVFRSLGFQNVTLTNIGSAVDRGAASAAADAENLPYGTESFDYVVAHAVLHHCHSPHRALLEMYRVAAKAAIFFESRDSFVMRCAERLGAMSPYEISAVAANNGSAGGVADTCVPNYVYRWTEREVRKTIASFAPHATHKIEFAHGYGTPCSPSSRPGIKGFVRGVCVSMYKALAMVFPSQRNLMACCIHKPQIPRDLQRWLISDEGQIRFRAP